MHILRAVISMLISIALGHLASLMGSSLFGYVAAVMALTLVPPIIVPLLCATLIGLSFALVPTYMVAVFAWVAWLGYIGRDAETGIR